jgi:hypothetical protein
VRCCHRRSAPKPLPDWHVPKPHSRPACAKPHAGDDRTARPVFRECSNGQTRKRAWQRTPASFTQESQACALTSKRNSPPAGPGQERTTRKPFPAKSFSTPPCWRLTRANAGRIANTVPAAMRGAVRAKDSASARKASPAGRDGPGSSCTVSPGPCISASSIFSRKHPIELRRQLPN